MTATEVMERTTGNEDSASRSESEAKAHDQRAPAADDVHRTPSKKRRKVNHGELVACFFDGPWPWLVSPPLPPRPLLAFPPPLLSHPPSCRALKLTRPAPWLAACLYCRRSVSHSSQCAGHTHNPCLPIGLPRPGWRGRAATAKSTLQQHTDVLSAECGNKMHNSSCSSG